MPADTYLKKALATNIATVVTMKKRGGSYPEKKYGTDELTGKMETLYIFEDATGRELKHYAKEREEETLRLFSPGARLQVVLQETLKQTPQGEKRIGFLVWTPEDGAEAQAARTPQMRSNTAETRMHRQQDDAMQERQMKDVQICLQGFMQQALPFFLRSGEGPMESRVASALNVAVLAREALLNKSREIVQPRLESTDPSELPFD